MICPNCGVNNTDDSRFCMSCGTLLKKTSGTPSDPGTSTTLKGVLVPDHEKVSNPLTPPPPPPKFPTTPINPPPAYSLYPPPPYSSSPNTQAFNIWGPFAGFGTRRHHLGWLMDNRGDCAQRLIDQVTIIFNERSIPKAQISRELLTAKGLVVEQRPYFILRRNLIQVGLYISDFGRDLFVSIASYLKPPISNVRVVIMCMMLLFGFYTTFILPASLSNQLNGLVGGGLLGGSSNSNDLVTLLCIFGPLGALNNIILFILFWYSIYKWVTEKDFFAILRTKPNEFNEDDLMAMEKAVEQTVRISLDEIGLKSIPLIPTNRPINNNIDRLLI